MVKKVIKKVERVEEPVEEVKEVKKKRVMSKEQLEHLARIRELAATKKRELKERDTKVSRRKFSTKLVEQLLMTPLGVILAE